MSQLGPPLVKALLGLCSFRFWTSFFKNIPLLPSAVRLKVS